MRRSMLRFLRPPSICRQSHLSGLSRQLNLPNHSSPVVTFSSMPASKDPPVTHVAYRYIEDVEKLSNYRPGGYHPMTIGTELHGRYRVIHKLGYGTYSTIWLARDKESQELVAVKVGTADSSQREVDVISALTGGQKCSAVRHGRDLILPVLDRFEIRGPNGVHPCYVTIPARETIAGAKDGSYSRLFQLDVVRALAAQLILAVAHVHSHGYIHGDIHLGNVLLRLPCDFSNLSDEQLYEKYSAPQLEPLVRLDHKTLSPGVPSHAILPAWFGEPSEEVTIKESNMLLSDFGESFSPSQEQRYESHTPISIRPPETRFEPDSPLSFSSDIWTLACAIWSISSQRPLFDGTFATEDDITREQVDTLGPLPPEWWRKWDARQQWFTEAGSPKNDRPVRSWEDRFEDSIQKPRRDEGLASFDTEESSAIRAMMRSMLAFKPEDRPTIKEVVESDWMLKWGLPTYERAHIR